MIFNPSFKERQIYAAGQKQKPKHQVKYLKGVLSVELTDITAKNVRAPDDREVLRRHPGPLRVQGHLVQVPHQEVDCPGNGTYTSCDLSFIFVFIFSYGQNLHVMVMVQLLLKVN